MTTPYDLITEILLRLQVKPLLRFQCVSKPLFALLNGPYFINLHLRCSIENNIEHTLIAETSPYSNMEKDLYILNFSDIPNIPEDDHSIQTFLNIPVDWNEPVKIFRPFYLQTKTTIATAIVGCCNGLDLSGPASSNRALRWVVHWEGQSAKTIVAFNLATEKFRVHALPCQLLHSNICLEVVRGWLCVCRDGYCQFNHIWLEYEVASNRTLVEWLAFYNKPVVFSKDDKEVLMKEF
ncbi:uncharacterized protein LOC132174008 [Corylus avellana]|uniref:uncharacterized protein LOC132169425 n=1 Tax=Corylus avellana TaxID=13451 RepID=UPI00286A5560|nr:uncharacterized protein LOC132169425 [Corylus avellana]XP_059441708.1 uncharacterized protein LOC132174008 [Corylus avellana]